MSSASSRHSSWDRSSSGSDDRALCGNLSSAQTITPGHGPLPHTQARSAWRSRPFLLLLLLVLDGIACLRQRFSMDAEPEIESSLPRTARHVVPSSIASVR